MENNINNLEDIPPRDLEKEIDEISKRLSKSEENKKWYRNNPFVLSIIVFIFTASASLYTINFNKETKIETAYNNRIASIKSSISELKQFEKEFIKEVGSANIDPNSKSIITAIYYSKINEVVDDILSKMNKSVIEKIEASTLNDFARYLQLIGNTKEAVKINLTALSKCRDKYTIVTIKRSLGNLFSIPGKLQDIQKSRKYRNEALVLTRSYSGEYAIENIMSSFELWANDEYYNFKQKHFANSLIDSAIFYANKLQDYNMKKYENIKRLKSTKNFYNDKLNINFIYGGWDVFKNKKKIGRAIIINLGNGFYIDIDLIKNDSLENKIFGNGYFNGDDKMKFSVTSNFIIQVPINIYEKQKIPQQRFATMNLIIKNKNNIDVRYSELGEKTQDWQFVFDNQ